MEKIKEISLVGLTLIVILIFGGCSDYSPWDTILGPHETLIIKGEKSICDGAVELRPGTRVVFKPKEVLNGYIPGSLVFSKGAKLIAKGTHDNPIIFEDASIGFKWDSGNSVLEYCEFQGSIMVGSKKMCVRYIKFNSSSIWITPGWPELGRRITQEIMIENNSFEGEGCAEAVILSGDSVISPDTSIVIRRNTFKGAQTPAIWILEAAEGVEIESNDFVNCQPYAVGCSDWSTNKLTIKHNYILDCAGQSGVDTAGEQSYNVTYENPRTQPVSDAGCGW